MLKNAGFNKICLLVLATFSFVILPVLSFSSSETRQVIGENYLYQQAWQMMLERIEWTNQNLDTGKFPMLADNVTGEWKTYDSPKWTGGFWVGMLWLAYEKTADDKYLQYARAWNNKILGYEEEDNHDRGFVYYYSSAFGYQLTRDPTYRKSAFKAARKLVDMFEKNSKVIPQNKKDRTNIIIDTMVNLPLLWWAYDQADETDSYKLLYKEIAISQADKTMMDFIRIDGSTFQSVHYDTLTGEIIKKHTHQGFADSSCWSRGQSWGVYGFTAAYEATRNIDYLNKAIQLAEYIQTYLPPDHVPWYDYDDPGKFKDTSAGAIAVSGMLKLATLVDNEEQKLKLEKTAKQMLTGLIKNHLTPFVDKDSPAGILRNGCYQVFRNANSETIWGDYYFMEALSRVLFPQSSNN